MLKTRENIYLGLLCLLLLTLVTSYYATIPIVLLVVFFFTDKKAIVKNKIVIAFKSPITSMLVVYFLIHLIGYLCAIESKFALKEMTQRLSYLILPMIIFGESVSYNNLSKLLRLFTILVITVLSLLVCYHYVFYQKSISSFVYFGYKTLAISPFYYSVFIFIAMKISIAFKPKFWQVELFVLFLFLFLLGNRTSILFVLIYMMCLFFKEVKLSAFKKVGVLFLLLLFGGVTIGISGAVRQKTNILFKTISFDIETIQTKNSITHTRNTLEHRILIWHLAKDIITENPMFGVGVANYKTELYNKYKEVNFKAAIKNRFNTHNQYIEEVLKFGVIWGGVFVCFVVLFVKQTLNYKNGFPVVLLVALLSFFESFWYRHHGVLIISFVIPLLCVYDKKTRRQLI